jgi:hypothetical protein
MPDMNKATISLWFRVPSASVSACQSDHFPVFGIPVFMGVIPLITWGTQQQRGTNVSPPSYLGVLVDSDILSFLDGQPRFEVNLQTPDSGIGDNIDPTIPVNFGNSNHYSGPQGAQGGLPTVQTDAWNHVLISWDLHSDTSTSATSSMYCAINDINQAGADLPALNNPDVTGSNQHMSSASAVGIGSHATAFALSSIPSNPIVIPALSSVSYNNSPEGQGTRNPIYRVELAELQIFCGVMLTTTSEINRRAFIDYKRDENGEVISDHMEPVDPKTAEDLIGKKQDVLLHGSNAWKDGNNTGSLGRDEDGNKIPDGQFEPTGTIKAYKPEPALGE